MGTVMSAAPVTNAGEAKAAPKPRTPLPTSRLARFSVTAGGSTAVRRSRASNTTSPGTRTPLPGSRPSKAEAGGPSGHPQRPRGASDKLSAGGKKGSSKEEEEDDDDENEEKVAGSLPKAAGRKYKCPDGSCEKECKHSCSLLRHVKQVHAQ
ncbi:hypothetical protein CPLU01_04262 [Colletotrichum plurivorum]|uniref:C2H2-type domain-containing protein n=1 Tax=Colletotrichum plurivorum TaxID=2175906 RepID=A0A8H6KRG1_9PEZI|nr:hypothetical protein CPLU01_04262 [Colletotrichum plurivorum]